MMGLFKKPNRKFRQRVTRNDSDEEETQNDQSEKKTKDQKIANVPPSTDIKEKSGVISKEGSSKDPDDKTDFQPNVPAAKLLSFLDDEDDGEVFKLKKSNYSRRLAKQLERERKKLQENPVASTSTVNPRPDTKADTEKKDEIKQAKNFDKVLSGKEAEDMDVDDDDGGKESQQNPFKDVLQSGIIPDAATIYAMKKHRQLAREMKDFIPTEPIEKEEESQSRLIREDDNDRSDDDDDDEPSRLSFNLNASAVERQKVREAFLSLQDESQAALENEDAAELERWEREQIRKGVSIVQGLPPQPQQMPENEYYTSYLSSGTEGRTLYSVTQNTRDTDTSSKPFYKTIQDTHKSELTTQAVKARLEERLASLKEQHEAHKRELESVQKEIIQNTELIEKHEKDGPGNASRFQLYQQMRGYVRDLVECLDMKVAHVDLLDTRIMDLYKTRAKTLIARRQQDIRDQANEYSALSCKVLKGNTADISNEKNGHYDEIKLRRAAEREGRRIRRRKNREQTVLPSKHHEGTSSDDEEPDIEIMKFKEKKESLLEESKQIFEDVVEEFGMLQGVMVNFEKWKNEQSRSYCDAFVPLCLPKIFGPFVRIEMLGWNPLEEDIDLEKTEWFKSLTLYGYEQNEDVVSEKDPDVNLLPTIVEKTLIPKITAFIKDVWDPMSTAQTMRLVNVIKQYFEEYPAITGKSKQVQTLLQTVCIRIQSSLDDDVFIPLYPKELLENRSMGSSVFFQRQFWSTVKLLKNIIAWDGIIAEGPLQDMSLSSLLNRYLLMGLNTSIIMKDSVEKCKTIVSLFPKPWFSNNTGSNTLPQVKQFSQYLVRYTQSLDSQIPKRGQPEEDIKTTVIDIVNLLITLGSLDEAVVLAKQFSISGFKKEK